MRPVRLAHFTHQPLHDDPIGPRDRSPPEPLMLTTPIPQPRHRSAAPQARTGCPAWMHELTPVPGRDRDAEGYLHDLTPVSGLSRRLLGDPPSAPAPHPCRPS